MTGALTESDVWESSYARCSNTAVMHSALSSLQYAALFTVLSLSLLVDRRSLGELKLSHHPYELVKCLIDVDAQLGTALNVGDLQLTAQLLRLFQRHDPLVVQVGLVADHQHRELVAVLYPQDLLVKFVDLIETRVIGDGEHEQKSFPGAHILLAHGTELLLAGRIENIQLRGHIVYDALFGVGIFDGGIVISYKVALYELDGDSRLANTATTHNNQLEGLCVRLVVTGHSGTGGFTGEWRDLSRIQTEFTVLSAAHGAVDNTVGRWDFSALDQTTKTNRTRNRSLL